MDLAIEIFLDLLYNTNQIVRVYCVTGILCIPLFANLVYCSNCNMSMKKTGAKGHEYLTCRTYQYAGEEHCTRGRSISFKALEDIVLAVIQSQIGLVADLQAIVTEINARPEINKQSLRINQLLENCQRDFEKETHILDSSYYDRKNGDISKEQYQRIREEAEKRLEQLRATLQNLAAEQLRAAKGIKANNEYFERFLKYQNVEQLDRLMLVELINKIYIDEDKSVKVEFNFSDQYLRVMDFVQQNTVEQPLKLTLEKKN